MLEPQRPEDEDYRPISGRRRLLIAVLAVATAVGVLLAMLGPKLRAMRAEHDRKAAGPAACSSQQSQACVGGTMGVISVPPAASAPR